MTQQDSLPQIGKLSLEGKTYADNQNAYAGNQGMPMTAADLEDEFMSNDEQH